MSNKIQVRRGVDAERGTVVLDSGEPGWTTDTKKLYVGDGATYGGILVTGGGGGGAGTLCDLSDVNCAGTVNGKALTYQNGTWIPAAVAGGGDMLISQYVTGQGTVYNASRLAGDVLATVQAHNVDASKITSGTFGLARIPSVDDARIPHLETLSYGGAFADAQIPALAASKITSGTFNAERIPILPTTQITSGTFALARIPSIDDIRIPDVDTLAYNAAFATAQIPAIGAYKIAAGTLAVARHETLDNLNGTVALAQVPTMDDGHIPNVDGLSYGGAFAVGQIPSLPAAKTTTGTFDDARIPNIDLNDLEDVNTAGTVNDKVLTFQSGTWIPAAVAGGGDMLISQYVTGQGTVYNASRLAGDVLATVQAHNVDAGIITEGTIGLARVPAIDDDRIPNLETLSYGAAFAAGQIPNLPTSKIATGTFGLTRLPSITNAYLAGDITSDKISALSGTAIAYPLNADTVGTTAIKASGVGNDELAGSGLDIAKCTVGTAGVARIPSLPTARITTGTFNLARIPAVDDARIPNLETLSYGAAFATAQIPPIGAYKVASGTLAVARHETLGNLNGTVALTQIPTMDDTHIPDLGASKITSGTFNVNRIETLANLKGTVTEEKVASLPTSKITTGTFGLARIPSIDNDHLAGEVTSDKIPALSGTAIAYPLNADTVGTTAIKASGVGNDELAGSGLDIAKCTVGTVGLARIPVIDDARIPDLESLSYGGAFATGQIPSLSASKTTTGTFNANRIPILPTDRYGSAVLVSGTRAMTGDLDFAKHQAKAIVLEVLGSHPASPATAQIYYNSGDDKVYIYVA